jgi:hypothetical protein
MIKTATTQKALLADLATAKTTVRGLQEQLETVQEYLSLLQARAKDRGERHNFRSVCRKLKLAVD